MFSSFWWECCIFCQHYAFCQHYIFSQINVSGRKMQYIAQTASPPSGSNQIRILEKGTKTYDF